MNIRKGVLLLKEDEISHTTHIYTSLSGKALLTVPQLNKGTAFTKREREELGLIGKLPYKIETIDEQCSRVYHQLQSFESSKQRYIYLYGLHNCNEILFYYLMHKHMTELLPIVYTPVVGAAVQDFSNEFRQARGLYLSYPEMDEMEQLIDNRTLSDIDIIVVSDGESVLGIGDQGVGAIDISIAKLVVYSVSGALNPLKTLPIMLDVGTNNQALLESTHYLGWKSPRVDDDAYYKFMRRFIDLIGKKFPTALLHWEDFSSAKGKQLLSISQDLCTFNDDIQGTGVVAFSTVLSAVSAIGTSLADQRIIIYGAGNAGVGIAEQIVKGMMRQKISQRHAYGCIWLIDREGLLIEGMQLMDAQKPYAKKKSIVESWQYSGNKIGLLTVINEVKPTMVIGTSAQSGHFTQEVVELICKHVRNPAILPLSNPSSSIEATPQQVIDWSKNKALVATGSPFQPCKFKGRTVTISQCNNALAFPGIGLGVLSVKATKVTPSMLYKASSAIAALSPIVMGQSKSELLPSISDLRSVTRKVAIAVASQAIEESVATQKHFDSVEKCVDGAMWSAQYFPIHTDNDA